MKRRLEDDGFERMLSEFKKTRDKEVKEKEHSSLLRLIALYVKKKNDTLVWKEHLCNSDECSPRSVSSVLSPKTLSKHGFGKKDVKRSGYVKPPFDENNVYVCRYGQVHVCDKDSPMNINATLGGTVRLHACLGKKSLKGTWVCLVSGKELGVDSEHRGERTDKESNGCGQTTISYAGCYDPSANECETYLYKSNDDLINVDASSLLKPIVRSFAAKELTKTSTPSTIVFEEGGRSKRQKKSNTGRINNKKKKKKKKKKKRMVMTTDLEGLTKNGSFIQAKRTEWCFTNEEAAVVLEETPESTLLGGDVKDEEGEESDENDYSHFSVMSKTGSTRDLDSKHPQLMDSESKKEICYRIVYRLFYSKIRNRIYSDYCQKKYKEARKALVSYFKSKHEKGKLPVQYDAFVIFYASMHSHDSKVPTGALKANPKFMEFICTVIMNQWRLTCMSPYGLNNCYRLNFQNHVLAVLNHVSKGGFEWNGRMVITGCDYVAKYMPPINHLHYYKYYKNCVTSGTSVLKQVYESIERKGLQIPYKMLHSFDTTEFL